MKNNISSDKVFNRKIIIELRFNPIPQFLDKKGTLIGSITDLNIIPQPHWGIGDSAIKLSDSSDEKEDRIKIAVEINRLSLISTKINSINDYFSKMEKLVKTVQSIIGNLEITRIGCRIQGTYKTKSPDFSTILDNFKKSFPTNVFIEGYPVKDLRFQINYQNGMYNVGPISKDDQFLKASFPYVDRNNNEGVGLDIDNYLLKTNSDDLTGLSKIKDVFIASLAVEKSLVENISDL